MVIAILAVLQMPWTVSLPDHGAAIDILRPKFEGGGTSLTSVAVFMGLRAPIGARQSLRVELPFVNFSPDAGSGSSAVGNPYLGVESSRPLGLGWQLGIRGPLAPDDEIAPQLGALSDITRIEAFLPNLATASAHVRYRFHDAPPEGRGFLFEAGGGPTAWFPTDGPGDTELVLHHHMMAGYRGASHWFAAGFGGLTIISEGEGSVGERTAHQAGASFGFTTGKARPAIHVIAPLGESFGFGAQIVFGFGLALTLN